MKAKRFHYCYILSVALLMLTLLSCESKSKRKDSPKPSPETEKETVLKTLKADCNISVLKLDIKEQGRWHLVSEKGDLRMKIYPKSGTGPNRVYITLDAAQKTEPQRAYLRFQGEKRKYDITIEQDPKPTDPALLVYRLPIVFHLMYNSANKEMAGITTNKLQTLLDKVNMKYKSRAKINNSHDIGVEFVLAETKPDGRPMTDKGLNTINVSETSFKIFDIFGSKEKKWLDELWDINRYINVYLYHFKGEEDNGEEAKESTLGIAQLPFLPDSYADNGHNAIKVDYAYMEHETMPYVHGIALNCEHFDNIHDEFIFTDESFTYSMSNFVNTLAHELGHYLGLRHVFTDSKDANASKGETGYNNFCEDTDYVEDTPSYNRDAYILEFSRKLNELGRKLDLKDPKDFALFKSLFQRTSCNTENFESTNLMDYFCGLNHGFTPEQKERMRHVLKHAYFMPGPKYNDKLQSTRADTPLQILPVIDPCPPVIQNMELSK